MQNMIVHTHYYNLILPIVSRRVDISRLSKIRDAEH